jgi:hypothetical protein
LWRVEGGGEDTKKDDGADRMCVVWDVVTCSAHEGVTFNLWRSGTFCGNRAVWRRRAGAYRDTAPIVLARLAVCGHDAPNRLLERFDANALLVRRIG